MAPLLPVRDNLNLSRGEGHNWSNGGFGRHIWSSTYGTKEKEAEAMAGQIVERGKNKYLVRVYMGEVNGKRKYHNKTIHGNKKDAQTYLNKALRERDMGTFVEPTKETLGAFLERWLNTVAKARVAPSTFKSYQDYISYYLNPSLGDMALSKICASDIQTQYNAMLGKELSPRTVRYTHAILRSALNQAVKWDLLYRNPCELVDLPKQKKEEMKVLTPVEAALFMDATVFSKWKAFFSLLLSSGMRPGEAFGLKWPDIDFARGRIHVQRALSKGKDGWRLEEPKTAQSRRSIPLPASVIKDLLEHRKSQDAEKSRATMYKDNGFVFAGEQGEPPCKRTIISLHFKPLLKDVGLPDIRLYDLRHTCATLLLSAGENPKVVSERLGHASVTMTLDTYSHVLPDMQEKAAAKLEDILFSGRHTKNAETKVRTLYAH